MAKRPKPVPQMTTAQFEAVSRLVTTQPAFTTWWLGAGRKAFIARAAAIRTCMTPLATSRFTGSASGCAAGLSVFGLAGHDLREHQEAPPRLVPRRPFDASPARRE